MNMHTYEIKLGWQYLAELIIHLGKMGYDCRIYYNLSTHRLKIKIGQDLFRILSELNMSYEDLTNSERFIRNK